MLKYIQKHLVNTGLKYIRRNIDGEKIYYLVNHTSKTIDGFIPLQIGNKEVVIFDPLTKDYGNAIVTKESRYNLGKTYTSNQDNLLF